MGLILLNPILNNKFSIPLKVQKYSWTVYLLFRLPKLIFQNIFLKTLYLNQIPIR